MNIEIVIGANYGDEGKGLAVDFLCMSNSNPVVVLNNGGCQRGHTVDMKDGRRHVFHHFGSGTFRNAPTYFTKKFYLNPMEFIREYTELETEFGIRPVSSRHPDCILQLPSDIAVNWHLERERGKTDTRHGSVGCGIWETYRRINKFRNAVTFGEFCRMNYLDKRKYINEVADLQRKEIRSETHADIELYDLFMNNGFIDHFIADCMVMSELCPAADIGSLKTYDTVVIENGQGLLLDENFSNDPDHSTPSHTGAYGAASFLNELGKSQRLDDIDLNYISRPYLTRHGVGVMENEIIGKFPFVDQTNQPNEWQGSLRYGMLDIEKLHFRIDLDMTLFRQQLCWKDFKINSRLVLTHLNEVDIDLPDICLKSSTPYAEDVY